MVSVATNLGRRARVVTEQPGTEEPHLDTKAQTKLRSRLCESRGGRPGLPFLSNKPTVSADIKR